AHGLSAALHLAGLGGDGDDAELGPHRARPDLGAVARDDALLLVDLGVAGRGARDARRAGARAAFDLEQHLERGLDGARQGRVDAGGIEATARQRHGREFGYALATGACRGAGRRAGLADRADDGLL